MNLFVTNLVLAVLWTAVAGELTATTLAVGFLIGYAVLFLARPVLGPSAYFRRLRDAGTFGGYFLRELVVSSLRVAYDVLSPTLHARPGVIAVPLRARTDAEITAFANVVSLTPGTLSLDVAEDRRVLYIHAMYIDGDVEGVRARLARDLEAPVLALMR